MAELGPDATALHREVAARRGRGVDLVVGVGELARAYLDGAGDGAWFADVDAAADGLPALLEPGDVVLLKASRGGRPRARWLEARLVTQASSRAGVAGGRALAIIVGGRFIRFLHARCARPEHPRGGPGGPQDQAGHADDGRPPDRRASPSVAVPARSPSRSAPGALPCSP